MDTLPDAILSDTDVMAIGALNCLHDHGIKVPIESMSIKAVELLVDQMLNQENEGQGTAFDLELIIRESTKKDRSK